MAIINRLKSIVKKIIPKFIVGAYHFAMAFLGALLYGFPSRKLKVIGVTGTNGKSSTAAIIAWILKEAGYKAALSSSVEFQICDQVWKNSSRMTMPGRVALQKFLRRAAVAGCRYAVVEVSSEGVRQHRHRFIDFEAAVFTNLAPEHIESHGSFENYRAAKGTFFNSCRKIHILNTDDPNCAYFAKFKADKKYGYGINPKSDKTGGLAEDEIVLAQNINLSPAGSSFEVGGVCFDLKLLGEFNVYNALAAICAAQSQGIDLETCRRALEKLLPVSGRMEKVADAPFEIFIDYAVTPDALKNAYQTAKIGLADGKLICVLGACGGGRDKWKRPVMGDLAKKYCDRVILTNEDPYDESSQEIIDQIAGAGGANIEKIIDRREAIKRALEMAKSGDKVLITGKGCEDSMCLAGGKKISWNDKTTVLEEFAKIKQDK